MYKAKDNYSIGKQRTVTADEVEKIYMSTIAASSRRFICPSCGEYVAFVRRYKYKSYFKHCNSNDATKFCELRSQSEKNLSIYEWVGLPLYLKKSNNKFELNLGFYSIDETIMNISREEFKVFIEPQNDNTKESISYFIDNKNFSTIYMSLKRISFLSERYKLRYSSTIAEKIFKKVWGTDVEGIQNNGALFIYGENGGRKVRINEEINTNTDYFYLCKNVNILDRYNYIDYECCGNISFKSSFLNVHYNIYKVKLKSYNDEQFKNLYNFCRNNFKVSLLYKPSKLISIWPPTIQKDNEFSYLNNENEKLFVLKTDETSPQIFMHRNDIVQELEGEKLDNDKYLLKLNFTKERVAVNINEIYNSNFVFLNSYRDNIKTYSNSIYIKDNDNNLINYGTYSELPTKKIIRLIANSKCDIIHFKRNKMYRNYKIKGEQGIIIDNITFGDEIVIINGIECTTLLKYIKNDIHNLSRFEDELVYMNICKDGGIFITPPIWTKKLLLLLKSNSKTFALVRKFLITNKMPINVNDILRDLYETMKGDSDYEGKHK